MHYVGYFSLKPLGQWILSKLKIPQSTFYHDQGYHHDFFWPNSLDWRPSWFCLESPLLQTTWILVTQDQEYYMFMYNIHGSNTYILSGPSEGLKILFIRININMRFRLSLMHSWGTYLHTYLPNSITIKSSPKVPCT